MYKSVVFRFTKPSIGVPEHTVYFIVCTFSTAKLRSFVSWPSTYRPGCEKEGIFREGLG